MTIQELVRDMCTAFGQDVHDSLHRPEDAVRGLRLRLLSEKFREYMLAEKTTNPLDISRGLARLVIAAHATAAAYGINLDQVIRAETAAYKTKALSPDEYVEPDLKPILGDLNAWEAAA